MTYFVVKKKDDRGQYSYGILCGEICGSIILVEREINDITQKQAELEALVCLCNKLSLDIIHIDDVIEDFIG